MVPLREKAEQTLLDSIRLEEREAQATAYSELLDDLGLIRATEPLTADHVKALGIGIRIVQAAQERLLKGNPGPLMEVVDELKEAEAKLKAPTAPVAPVETPSVDVEYMPFSKLAALYMEEQRGNLAEKSVRDITSSNKVLAEAL